MNIFVTGGTGFIGSNLIHRLVADGHNIRVPVRKQSKKEWLPSSNVEIIETDLSEPAAIKTLLKGVDVVFHLASIRGSGWAYSERQMLDTNIKITENLLNASAGAVEHFIYISSVSVHGHLNGQTADENYPYNPVTKYGMTKCESERLVTKYHIETGLKTTIFRPVITYGPKDTWGMIPKLTGLISSKKYLTVGNGENRVHLIYIDDLVNGMLSAMNNINSDGETFILAGKEPITINRLVSIIKKILMVSVPDIHVPLWFAKTAAVTLETVHKILLKEKEPVITKDKINIMTVDRAYNIKKSKNLLGFAPAVDYEEGLNTTIGWLKQNNVIQCD